MQHVNGYSGRPGCAITVAASAAGNGNGKVIEFYVPEKFRKPSGKSRPPEQCGGTIPFPTPEKKSVFWSFHLALPQVSVRNELMAFPVHSKSYEALSDYTICPEPFKFSAVANVIYEPNRRA